MHTRIALSSFIVLLASLPFQARADYIRDTFDFRGLKFECRGTTFGTAMATDMSVTTKHEIRTTESSFFTLPDNPAEWHLFLTITGNVDSDVPVVPNGSVISYRGDVYLEKELQTFSYPDGTNFIRSYLVIDPSSIDGESFNYSESTDSELNHSFVAMAHVHGTFPDASMGKVFIVPEPVVMPIIVLVSCCLLTRHYCRCLRLSLISRCAIPRP